MLADKKALLQTYMLMPMAMLLTITHQPGYPAANLNNRLRARSSVSTALVSLT